MDWVRTRLATRIDLRLHSVEEDVSEWTRLRRSWLKPSSNPTYILTTNLKSFPLSLASFSTSMSANWTALTRVGSITIGRLTLWSSSSSCLCPTRSYFMSGFMPTSMACDKIACCRNCCCIWTRLVLSGWNLRVRERIFRSSAGSNNEQSCWVFHVLGESCTTIICSWTSGMCSTYRQSLSSGVKSCSKECSKRNHQSVSIRSGVEFSVNENNLRSFCKHPRSMQHFFSDSRILSLPL